MNTQLFLIQVFNGLVNGWVGNESYDAFRPRLADAKERVARYGFKDKA